MSNAPDSHILLANRLWPLVENAVIALGGQGWNMQSKINSLRGHLSREVIDELHYLRKQRNRVGHINPKPLDDPIRYKKSGLDCLSILGFPVSQEVFSKLPSDQLLIDEKSLYAKTTGPNYIMILIISGVILTNVLGLATNQIGNFLQMMKANGGVLMAIGAIFFLYKAMK